MKTLKFICGMFLATGLFVACSNEEGVVEKTENQENVEEVGKVTIDLSITTQAGDVKTRGAADVDGAGAPKGNYPFNHVYLVKANSDIPAKEYKESRDMDVTKGVRLDLWFTDNYTKVAMRPSADRNAEPLVFNVSEITDKGDVNVTGDTFFYSSQISGKEPIVSLPNENGNVYTEYGDKLFISEQFVFCVGKNKQLTIYQVYPKTDKIYPKEGNSLWPVDLNRFTAGINARFMFVDTDENALYGHAATAVAERWKKIFTNVSLNTIYTDGAFLTNFPTSFNLCERQTTKNSNSIRLYGEEEKTTKMEQLTYNRASSDVPAATEGWGFKSKAYPFIFPITDVDNLFGVRVDVCIPDLNTRMKCSIKFPTGDGYAFKANTTTFLWLMMDIDEFKSLCIKNGVINEDGTPVAKTRSAGMRDIEVELPSDCLLVE